MGILSNTTFSYGVHVVDHPQPKKGIEIYCPLNKYTFDAETGAMDIRDELKDEGSCLARVRAADEHTKTFTFTWDGHGIIAKDDEKPPKLLPYSGQVCPDGATNAESTFLV